MQRISQKVYETDKGLWNTIKKWFENLVAKLKKLFADLDPQSENGRIVREMGDRLDSVRQMWADMVVEAGDIATELGIEIDVKSDTRYSHKALEKLDTDYLSAVNRGDMETAQKMVDEAAKKAGYNVKAYHGTPNEVFTEFKDEKIGSNTDTGIFGHGFYFSTDKDTAVVYATEKGNIMPVYLDLGKVWWAVAHRNINDVAAELEMDESALVLRGYGGKGRIVTPTMPQARQFTSHLQNKGYNSVVVQHGKGNYEIVIFNSNRIKSSDPVTYDDEGNVIPLSQRFNGENEDIRYSKKNLDTANKKAYNKRKKLYTDEFATNAMIWSRSAGTMVGEQNIFYRNGKWVLVEKTDDYFVELGAYSADQRTEILREVKEYNETLREDIHSYLVRYESERGYNMRDYGDAEWERYGDGRSGIIYRSESQGNGSTDNKSNEQSDRDKVKRSRKTVDPITSREELAKALSKVAKGEDRAIVESYKANVNLIKGETARLESLRKEIDEIKYKKSITYEGRELSVKEFEQIAYTRAEETGIEAERVKFKEQSLYKKDHDKKS